MDAHLVASFAVTLIAFTAIWLIHVWLKDASIVDYYWGPGFAVIGWTGLVSGAETSPVKNLLLVAITVWSARLAVQLFVCHRLMKGEDARYQKMRQNGGSQWWLRNLYKVFLLQAGVLWLVATPVHAIIAAPADAGLSLVGFAGCVVFLVGLCIETVADWQLYSHRLQSNSQRQTFSDRLWAYSRHPNYLGEIVLWMGLGLAAYDLSGMWWAWVGPLVLAALIRYVTLPLTEQHMMDSRSDYAAYTERTPALLPTVWLSPFRLG